MGIFESLSSVLGSVITPFTLFISAFIMTKTVRLDKIMYPKRFIKTLTDTPKNSTTTPFRALTVALAGTLGVGNITGVTTALISGGPGSIFWMWIGALAVLSIKYAEVYLAVKHRRHDENGWFGGAMYYIEDGLNNIVSEKYSKVIAAGFAILCCTNSLITGNLVQANAAISVIPGNKRFLYGILLGFFVLLAIVFGARKIERLTSLLIPPLTAIYIFLTLAIIWNNRDILIDIIWDIIKSAFNFRAAVGGAFGFSIREAMRFGIMRGIFSNEAGCGTSPTAHASADTKSPHHQACLGIFEVIFDTIILCSLTAFVILIADRRFSCIPWHNNTADSADVTLESFRLLTGEGVYVILIISIILFAYATILAQLYYGNIAIGYLSNKKRIRFIYSVVSVACTVIGAMISAPVVWLSADIIIGMMTVVNCIVIILLRDSCRDSLLR